MKLRVVVAVGVGVGMVGGTFLARMSSLFICLNLGVGGMKRLPLNWPISDPPTLYERSSVLESPCP